MQNFKGMKFEKNLNIYTMKQQDCSMDLYRSSTQLRYCSSNTTEDHCSTTYGFSAAPDNNWTESHEITTQTFGDRGDSTDGYTNTTHTREFLNGNEVTANTTTHDQSPTAPPSEATGGGISEYVRPGYRDDVVIPICGTTLNSGIPDYSRTRDYNRVIPPRIDRYSHITPRQNVKFERDCHNLNQIDTSKLSNAEFLSWVDKYERLLNTEERRQANKKLKHQLLKGILILCLALIIIGAFIGMMRTGTRKSANRYLHGQGYIGNREESDVDRVFRVNPYLNGEKSFEDLDEMRKRIDKQIADLQRILDNH
ncbi:uncharacterized protein LOC100678992 [Nasonia vitripennis]|uniref:Uncharacterized protein n=1 Tax=Nasonia vitripennis TaxID=7425 RepID=A0A7M7R483_NASVI|nr:uncharacterized protein LOC100678992 [Nasonia vitripennis]